MEASKWCTPWQLPTKVMECWHERIDRQFQCLMRLCYGCSQNMRFRMRRQDFSAVAGLVVTPADHFPHTAHVACPFAFDQLLEKTFLDPDIFQPCKVGTQTILSNLRFKLLRHEVWQKRYGWAICWTKALPVARILLKPSKMFTKARPIIACGMRWHARLTIFLAKALYQIMTRCFPRNSTFNIDLTLTATGRMRNMLQAVIEPVQFPVALACSTHNLPGKGFVPDHDMMLPP